MRQAGLEMLGGVYFWLTRLSMISVKMFVRDMMADLCLSFPEDILAKEYRD